LHWKIYVLTLGIVMLLGGFTILLFLAPLKLAESITDIYVLRFPNLVDVGAYALVVGFIVTFIGIVEIAGERKILRLNRVKIIIFALSAIAIGIIVPHMAWTSISPNYTPNWAFLITTDKSTYELGEPVQIRVTLENHGNAPHWFVSVKSSPVQVIIWVRENGRSHVWYSIYAYDDRWEKTRFMIPPQESLERTFVWNQTGNAPFAPEIARAGIYTIRAYIPLSIDVNTFAYEPYTFATEIRITITST